MAGCAMSVLFGRGRDPGPQGREASKPGKPQKGRQSREGAALGT